MVSGIGSSSSWSQVDRSAMAQQMFKKLDADSSGGIDATELAALAQDGKGPSADEILAKFDTDGDGIINESENQTAMESAPPPPPPPGEVGSEEQEASSDLLADLLARLDGSSSSSSTDETDSEDSFSQLLAALNGDDDAKNSLDDDGDGSISSDELAGMLARMEREALFARQKSTSATEEVATTAA